MGYVGPPLAVAFAEAGLAVVGIERDRVKVAAPEKGDSYVEDVTSELLCPLLSSGRLTAKDAPSALGEAT